MLPRPHTSTLFPYTTLFRSVTRGCPVGQRRAAWPSADVQVGVSKNGQLSGRRRDRPTRSLLLISRQAGPARSEEHTSELQSRRDLVCRLLLEKKNKSRRCTT